MSDIIETLLLRNLQEVFGEGDPARRRAAIEELYTEDCTVLLPIGRYVGRAALDQVAGELRASHPGFVYTPHRPPQAVQDGGRLAWGSGPPGEPPRYAGLDVIIVRDGKIAALYVFLDSPPSMMADTATNTHHDHFPDRWGAFGDGLEDPDNMSVFVKGSRTPAADERCHALGRQASEKPEGEETAGRIDTLGPQEHSSV